jgi:hypothetical protein
VVACAPRQKVVELILEHAEQRPHEGLGVIAMGIKHSDRVDEALRRALRDRPDPTTSSMRPRKSASS